MRRFLLIAVAVLAVAGGYRYMAASGTGGKSKALIWAYISREEGGPYTVNVKAVDTSTGEVLHDEDTPVVGTYGPATLLYDGGHSVELTVTLKLGKPVPMSSYVRIQPGGIGRPKKSCTPTVPGLTELSCSVRTS